MSRGRQRLAVNLKETRLLFRVLRRSFLAMVGLVLILGFCLIGIFGPLLAPDDPYSTNANETLLPPSFIHFFGTDNLGRDIFSRILHGARYTLIVALVVVGVSTIVGSTAGAVAGWFRGRTETVIMRVVDIFLAFPVAILAMALAAAVGRGIENMIVALSVFWWPTYARLVHGQALSVRESQYVEAARVAGASNQRIIFHHVLPNSLAPVLVMATVDLGWVLLNAAWLSFIGLGAQRPLPEWGLMIAEGRDWVRTAWWYPVFPGLAIALVVLGFNLLGDSLRDALDPRLRRTIELSR